MIYREFIDYCKKQEPKPTHTTRFIKRYQQINSGNNTYLHEAIVQGKMIHKREGEPDQKWHLLEAWYADKKNILSELNMPNWCNLKCPELLLWIAEVSGQQNKVEEIVNEILRNKTYEVNDISARRRMVQYIKENIDWNDIIEFIKNNNL